jgi:hypothetical protein
MVLALKLMKCQKKVGFFCLPIEVDLLPIMKPESMAMFRHGVPCRAAVLRSIRLLALLWLTCGLSACSSDQIFKMLLDDPPERPGSERSDGEVLLYNRDQYGDWSSERKYSEKQEQQLKAYQDYRRNKDD